jgi:hypothetical protein
MVRKQVYITPEQNRLLQRRAKTLGVPEAEVVRQSIELASTTGISLPFDGKAWQEEMKFIRKRMRMQVPQTGRAWTREELYDERFERYSRR